MAAASTASYADLRGSGEMTADVRDRPIRDADQTRGWRPMIELKLTAGDLAQLRFGISPLSEAMASLMVLHCPSGHPQHRRWVVATEARIRHLDRELLLALVPPCSPRASLPL